MRLAPWTASFWRRTTLGRYYTALGEDWRSAGKLWLRVTLAADRLPRADLPKWIREH